MLKNVPVNFDPTCLNSPTNFSLSGVPSPKIADQRPDTLNADLASLKKRHAVFGSAVKSIVASLLPKCFIHWPFKPLASIFNLNSESNKGMCIKTESPLVFTSVTLNRSAPLNTVSYTHLRAHETGRNL